MPLKPSYLMLAGAGAIVAVAGVKGWAPSQVFRDIISGHNPSQHPTISTDALITSVPGQSSGYGYGVANMAGGATGGNIATIAESLIGFPYKWAGKPATGVADCSSFCNWVVGHIAARSIPGFPNGSYTGTTHGPSTLLWLASIGTTVTKISRAQSRPDDLVIWQTHMGIIVDNGQHMVSDLNPSIGTKKTTIDKIIPFEIPVFVRLK
jgi:cell wall-associated NlpC family hydrolase